MYVVVTQNKKVNVRQDHQDHGEHPHPRLIYMSWVHWVIEGSCLWYMQDSHDATDPIAKAGTPSK